MLSIDQNMSESTTFDWTSLFPWHLHVGDTNANEREWIEKRQKVHQEYENARVNVNGTFMSKKDLVIKGYNQVAEAFKRHARSNPDVIDVVAKKINKPGIPRTIDGVVDYIKNNKVATLLVAAEIGDAAYSGAQLILDNVHPDEQSELQSMFEAFVESADAKGSPDGKAGALSANMGLEKIALISRLSRRFGSDTFRDMYMAMKMLTPADFQVYDQKLMEAGVLSSGVAR